MHSRYVRYVYKPSGAGPCLSIWLAAPRGAADISVPLIRVVPPGTEGPEEAN